MYLSGTPRPDWERSESGAATERTPTVTHFPYYGSAAGGITFLAAPAASVQEGGMLNRMLTHMVSIPCVV